MVFMYFAFGITVLLRVLYENQMLQSCHFVINALSVFLLKLGAQYGLIACMCFPYRVNLFIIYAPQHATVLSIMFVRDDVKHGRHTPALPSRYWPRSLEKMLNITSMCERTNCTSSQHLSETSLNMCTRRGRR